MRLCETATTQIFRSNACKFTPAGGRLTITTKLVIPERYAKGDNDDGADGKEIVEEATNGFGDSGSTHVEDGGDVHHRLSKNHLNQHNDLHNKPAPPLEWIVVRIEVSDTGCGIRPKDMVQSKLFCVCSALFLHPQMLTLF